MSSEQYKISISAFDDRFCTFMGGCPLRTTVYHHIARAIVLSERRRVSGAMTARWDSEMVLNVTSLKSLDMPVSGGGGEPFLPATTACSGGLIA
ncbi:hypothetical protein V1282_003392 [Nitrobacteraceae bacterium AZCC 2146]